MSSFLRSALVRPALRLRAGPSKAAAGSGKAAGGGKAGKAKRGKGGAADAAPQPVVPKEQRVNVTLGANIGKEGRDPPVLADSEYPGWLWSLLEKPASLSEMKRKMEKVDPEQMELPELHRFLKLDNRRRIKENNSLRAKS
eukprot:TRINITY_DN13539_c0_g1_i1.p2 TRINITY_DN13539_c0_g1~~TRINITY_DN13539_c0_g1_i1.p2  ORF type:complete len:141 (-),score=22.70 TRINITY_DN13539_c0_g1_i1:228-650(-)